MFGEEDEKVAHVMIQDSTRKKTFWYWPFEERVVSEESPLGALQKYYRGKRPANFSTAPGGFSAG